MKAKREKILENPEAYRQEQINKRLPRDFDDLHRGDAGRSLSDLEDVVASVDPSSPRRNHRTGQTGGTGTTLETREVESKLMKLKEVITQNGVFKDPKMKLLIFTEHKDTLDYLAGDGKEGRPFGKLREWGLDVTQIHGGMKIGDRDTPGTRSMQSGNSRRTARCSPPLKQQVKVSTSSSAGS